MKKAIIIHGTCDREEYFEMDFPSPSNAHWIPWLQQKLLRAGILCQTPEMPAPIDYETDYNSWKETFEQFDLDESSIFIGHSAGAGFILKWLSENRDKRFKKIILVAPWLDPNKNGGDFLDFDFSIDICDFAEEVHLLCSDDDGEEILITKDLIIEKSKAIIYHQYKDKGHFRMMDIGPEFEDLFKICL